MSIQTAVAPNSWAVVCLWRRFFALREQEQDLRLALVEEALERELGEDCPVDGRVAREARETVVREAYRGMTATSRSMVPMSLLEGVREQFHQQLRSAQAAQEERMRSASLNLSVPVTESDEAYYLAQ